MTNVELERTSPQPQAQPRRSVSLSQHSSNSARETLAESASDCDRVDTRPVIANLLLISGGLLALPWGKTNPLTVIGIALIMAGYALRSTCESTVS